MRVVCAWCGTVLKEGRGRCSTDVSYGICIPCAHSIIDDTPGIMRVFVDDIAAPVALVDGDCVVRAANGRACALLHKDPAQIEGQGCGVVFGCACAAAPDGCISREGCTGCELLRCVTHTQRTGKAASGAVVFLCEQNGAPPQRTGWRISTSKLIDCVVVRISAPRRQRKKGADPVTGQRSAESEEQAPPPAAQSR